MQVFPKAHEIDQSCYFIGQCWYHELSIARGWLKYGEPSTLVSQKPTKMRQAKNRRPSNPASPGEAGIL